MKLIQAVQNKITSLPGTGASRTLSLVLASSCNQNYSVNLLKVNGQLDEDNLDLVNRLMVMHREPDWSNQAQADAIQWLIDNGHVEPVK